MNDLVDDVPCGILTFDDGGVIRSANRTALDLLGHPPDGLVGRTFESILTLANRIFLQTHFSPMLRLHGRAEEIFLQLRTHGGDDLPVFVNAVRRPGPDGPTNVCVFLPVRHRRKFEEELLTSKRTAERALETNETLVAAKAELERRTQELDRKLRRLEGQNDALTRLSSILSHDLREPVRKIAIFTDILSEENHATLTRNGVLAVEKVNQACDKMDRLLWTLQQFISLDTDRERVTAVALDDVLDRALEQLAEQGGAVPEVDREPLPIVEGFERQLRVLFVNLLDNAVKFARPGERARVKVRSAVVQHNAYATLRGRYRYVDGARLTFEDHGIGFDPKYEVYVFDMLTKLDPTSPGLGYGLAMCRKVVDNHYGTITATGRPGRGTVFTVLLPLRRA